MSNFQIKIPKPCTANWVNMDPSFKGRFCANCQKEVIDFTKLNNTELHQYFEQKGDTVCGRFHQTQLDNFAVQSAQKSNPTWFKVNVIVVSCLTFFWNTANSKPVLKENLFYQEEKKGIKRIYTEKNKLDSVLISGRVIDSAGLAIPGARILFKKTGAFVETDQEGNFKLKVYEEKQVILRVAYFGYETQDISVDLRRPNLIVVTMKEERAVLGMVEVINFKKSLPKRITSFIKRLFTAH